MASCSLEVLIAGKHAGTLSQDESGTLSFAYRREYRGVPLSSAMPLATRTYRDKVVCPYLWGLLPEDGFPARAPRRPRTLISEKLEAVFEELEETSCAKAAAELKEHMLEPIAKLCERAKARL